MIRWHKKIDSRIWPSIICQTIRPTPKFVYPHVQHGEKIQSRMRKPMSEYHKDQMMRAYGRDDDWIMLTVTWVTLLFFIFLTLFVSLVRGGTHNFEGILVNSSLFGCLIIVYSLRVIWRGFFGHRDISVILGLICIKPKPWESLIRAHDLIF